jgi:diguanylate cyclase (GGDEF)-like protein
LNTEVLVQSQPTPSTPSVRGGTPQRQFVFVVDGQLQEPPTVRHLLRFLDPVQASAGCLTLMERFLADASLYALPAVDEAGKPLALIDRKQYIEFFSRPYSREIFGRRSVQALLAHPEYHSTEPVMVEANRNVEDVAQIIIDAGMQHMVTGFIVCSDGRYLGVANGHDLLNIITQRKQAELYHLAHYDALTGLPNRALFVDRFEQACRDAERRGRKVGLLFVDVDRFKQVNDSMGHSVGDAVLKKIASRLHFCARKADSTARLAGDEFVILMENLTDPADVEDIARRVVQAMREPMELHGHSLVVTVSVGSAVYPDDDERVSTLLAKADAAMYEAKSHGRNDYKKYSSATLMYNPASMILENDLRRAIAGGELLLHFQPQVDLASQAMLGVEALVRWRHPERGMVAPSQFIPIAEESGLIVPLGNWVLHAALAQLKAWRDQGLPALRVSINISPLQFRQLDFADTLQAALEQHGVPPALVELELTESSLMDNFEDVLRMLKRIKALGITLAIDDFGTGFSSLSYLRRFPIDRLKIDQSFVRDIERTPVNESIAGAIVALANSLSLGVIAEGIEKAPETAVLARIGCREGQGYLFAKPLAAEEIAARLTGK